MRLVLTVIGTRAGVEPDIDPRRFHGAIRKYRPKHGYGDLTRLDETDYASRAALRIINQAFSERFKVPGRFSRHDDILNIGQALHALILTLAAKVGVDPYAGSWATKTAH